MDNFVGGNSKKKVIVVGGGMAGVEASYYLAEKGIDVLLYEMRPNIKTFAHRTENFAELVCSNSFRSSDYLKSAVGILQQEMAKLGSIVMENAFKYSVPAGSALAVDRDEFSLAITKIIENHPRIEVKREEFKNLKEVAKDNIVIVATGPLSSENLVKEIIEVTGEENLHFFDAIAPIVYKDSIDFNIAFLQSRYAKTEDDKDYINCPMNEEQYYVFLNALMEAEKTEFKEWEKNTPYFDGCLPIEVMAERGEKTLLFSCMKPVGLTNPLKDEKLFAVVQLRQDNKLGTLYNMVGFQTKLKHFEQQRVFKLIPGLENAVFARLGGIHRNTFINSPKLLNQDLSLKGFENIYFAGQISGCEGYIESASMGLLCGMLVFQKIQGKEIMFPPSETAIGSMLQHITVNARVESFQPMNINFGLFDTKDAVNSKGRPLKNKEKKEFLYNRAKNKMDEFLEKWKK